MAESSVTYTGAESVHLQAKAMDLESGYLGRLFGSVRNAPTYIAGVALFFLILPGMGLLFISGLMSPLEYWKLINPLVTLILGYLFGRKSGDG